MIKQTFKYVFSMSMSIIPWHDSTSVLSSSPGECQAVYLFHTPKGPLFNSKLYNPEEEDIEMLCKTMAKPERVRGDQLTQTIESKLFHFNANFQEQRGGIPHLIHSNTRSKNPESP